MARRRGPTPPRPWQPLTLSHVVEAGSGERRVYGNDRYTVSVHPPLVDGEGLEWTHLSIHTHTRSAIGAHDWREFQRIKNQLAGPERYAVEVFPPESELVDTSNEYHLIVFPEGYGLPVDILGGEGGRAVREPGDPPLSSDDDVVRAADALGIDAAMALDVLHRKTKQRRGATG